MVLLGRVVYVIGLLLWWNIGVAWILFGGGRFGGVCAVARDRLATSNDVLMFLSSHEMYISFVWREGGSGLRGLFLQIRAAGEVWVTSLLHHAL